MKISHCWMIGCAGKLSAIVRNRSYSTCFYRGSCCMQVSGLHRFYMGLLGWSCGAIRFFLGVKHKVPLVRFESQISRENLRLKSGSWVDISCLSRPPNIWVIVHRSRWPSFLPPCFIPPSGLIHPHIYVFHCFFFVGFWSPFPLQINLISAEHLCAKDRRERRRISLHPNRIELLAVSELSTAVTCLESMPWCQGSSSGMSMTDRLRVGTPSDSENVRESHGRKANKQNGRTRIVLLCRDWDVQLGSML